MARDRVQKQAPPRDGDPERSEGSPSRGGAPEPEVPERAKRRRGRRCLGQPELLKRVFAVDVLSCHRCGGRREVLALITKGSVVCAILECLGLPTEGPVVHPARGPPELF